MSISRKSVPASDVIDYGSDGLFFADTLVAVEDRGPISHLIFATSQRDYDDSRLVYKIAFRVVVPTERLGEYAKMLAGEYRDIRKSDEQRVVN